MTSATGPQRTLTVRVDAAMRPTEAVIRPLRSILTRNPTIARTVTSISIPELREMTASHFHRRYIDQFLMTHLPGVTRQARRSGDRQRGCRRKPVPDHATGSGHTWRSLAVRRLEKWNRYS